MLIITISIWIFDKVQAAFFHLHHCFHKLIFFSLLT